MADAPTRAVLDTSVVVDLNAIPPDHLPPEPRIWAITLAELTAGPASASSAAEFAVRLDRVQRTEAAFDPIPFTAPTARAFGRICAAVIAHGCQPRGRIADLLIAATALAEGLPLVTRHPDDFSGLDGLITIIAV